MTVLAITSERASTIWLWAIVVAALAVLVLVRRHQLRARKRAKATLMGSADAVYGLLFDNIIESDGQRWDAEKCVDCNGEGWQQVAGSVDDRADCPSCGGSGR